MDKAKKISIAAQAAESHISFGMWGWAMLIGTSSSTGLVGYLKAQAEGLPWYDVTLLVMFVIIATFFLVMGGMAFWHWIKGSKRTIGHIDATKTWMAKPFENYQVVSGGTHSVSDIFRGDKIRGKMVFRDCIITGPGAVIFTGCQINNYAVHGNGVPPVISQNGDALGAYVNEFFQCTFDNVTFSNVLVVGNGMADPQQPSLGITMLNFPEQIGHEKIAKPKASP